MNDADVDVGIVGENDLAFELLMLLLLLADDENVVDAKGSEDGEPAVAANSHSHNHGQASSARSFILLIVSLAHRRWNSYGDVYVSSTKREFRFLGIPFSVCLIISFIFLGT